MIQICNCQFYVDYETIINDFVEYMRDKYSISVLNNRFITGTDMMCCCPFHNNGEERRPSMGIQLQDGYWHCFTCNEKGTFEDLVDKIFYINGIRDNCISYLLRRYEQNNKVMEAPQIKPKICNRPEPVKIDNNKPPHIEYCGNNYLHSRGISDTTAETFYVREDKDYVYFAVWDINGIYKYDTKRSTNGKFFYIPNDVEKEIYLANYFAFQNYNIVAICESQFNALSFIEHNIAAVALFGTGTSYQIELLKRFNNRVFILALDNDNAGRKGTKRLYEELSNKYAIQSVVYKNITWDINDYHKSNMFNKIQYKWGI